MDQVTSATIWTDMSIGIPSFSCTTLDAYDNQRILPPLACLSLKLNLFIGLALFIPFIFQLRLYYLYYGKKIFGTRQRLIYLCLLTIFLFTMTYSMTNIIAMYYITIFATQTLFCHLLTYFITKVSKLTSGKLIMTLHALNILILVAFGAFLFLTLTSPRNVNAPICPGFLDNEYSMLRLILLLSLIALYFFSGILLTKLLRDESECLLDKSELKKRNDELLKLKILIAVVAVAEVAQLAFIISNYSYYSDESAGCPDLPLQPEQFIYNLIVFLYRFFTIYAPIIALLWTIWITNDEVNLVFNEQFSEEIIEHHSRYASGLTFSKRLNTAGRSTIIENVFQENHSEDEE